MVDKNKEFKCLARFPIEYILNLNANNFSVYPCNQLISPCNYQSNLYNDHPCIQPQSPFPFQDFQNQHNQVISQNLFSPCMNFSQDIEEELTDRGSIEKQLSCSQLLDIESLLQLGNDQDDDDDDENADSSCFSDLHAIKRLNQVGSYEQKDKSFELLNGTEQQNYEEVISEDEDDIELNYLNEVNQLSNEVYNSHFQNIIKYKEFANSGILPLKMDLRAVKTNKFQGKINFAFIKNELEQKNKQKNNFQLNLMRILRKNQANFCESVQKFNDMLKKQSNSKRRVQQILDKKVKEQWVKKLIQEISYRRKQKRILKMQHNPQLSVKSKLIRKGSTLIMDAFDQIKLHKQKNPN